MVKFGVLNPIIRVTATFAALSALAAGVLLGLTALMISIIGLVYKLGTEGPQELPLGLAILVLLPIIVFVAGTGMSLIPGFLAGLVYLAAHVALRRLTVRRPLLLLSSGIAGSVGAWVALFMWGGWQIPTGAVSLLGLLLGISAGLSAGVMLLYVRSIARVAAA